MKINAGPLLLLCIGLLTNPTVGSAQAEDPDPAGQGAQTQEEQTGAIPTAPEEDYTDYIRPLDKLRAELSQQQALLEIVVDITNKIGELRNQDTQSDILVLLDEDLSQAERIKAVLSDTDHAEGNELAAIRAEIEFLKQMYIQTLQVQETSESVIVDEPVAWALGPSSIEYVQVTDNGEDGFVSFMTGTGGRIVIKEDEAIQIAGKTILLDSVKLGPDGRILIHFVVNGQMKTVYYPQ